jgi:DNA-binding SARP family transcriptional activator/WD40 repeat protein
MHLRVLGPLDAEVDGASVPLGGPKQRVVLALLIQAVGRRVSVDEIILAVYGDEPSPGARRTVQTYVYNLRQVLGDVLLGTGDGYVLDVDPTAIDAGRFDVAYRAALQEFEHEPERAAGRLLGALALWRGHPYADVESHGALDAEVARLQELRLLALERRIACDLALGRHRDLVGELESLTAEEPLREDLRAHQLVALYRSGRQGEALAVMAGTRRLLADELGIDPSPQLQLLERRILTQDPVLELEAGPRVEQRALLVAELDAESWTAARRAAALKLRDRVLAGTVERGDATILGLRGTAVFVAFADVFRAAQAAVVLAGLGTEPTLRLALDHGDVEVRDHVITGPPVNRAARIVALAHPGQILLSPDAHRALSVGGVAGWRATALGNHAVEGIDDPLTLYQVDGDGLRSRFPPLAVGRIPPAVPRSPSASIPGYELRSRLAASDGSVLYRAYQASVGREVAVRVIRRDLAADAAFIRRFEAEGQRVARLSHPHLLPLLDYWRDPGGAYLVHPLLSGETLRSRLSVERPTMHAALASLDRIAAALAYAHAHGVAHGRLHPGNVLIDDTHSLYVTDLGLGQMWEGSIGSSAPAYAAPETLGGGAPTAAADVYAMGVLAFELLEGRPPPLDEPLPLPDDSLGEVLARATSTDPADRWADVGALVAALHAATTGTSASPMTLTSARNPFRGLEPFLESDAPDFCGREALVGELLVVLGRQRLLTVVGPSGIGKSSVVRAGLVPALRGGAIEGSDRWLVTDLFPGSRPFEELAAALRRIAADPMPELRDQLWASADGLVRCVDRLLPGDGELLVVIDQFEELFTQHADEESRQRFLTSIATAATHPRSRLRVVMTLRADFFDRPLHHAAFAEVMRRGLVAVRAPSRAELARAVREPAVGVGVAVEDRLVERIVGDAVGASGGLPLLQHVLAERFEARETDRLTLAAYETSGGLRGAIGRKAEELYLGLPSGQREATRRLFLQLVTVDDEDEDTRRRVRVTEISRSGVDASDAQRVLELFGADRLLTFDRDPVTRSPTVEVAHESLLAEWSRLRGWIDAVRDDLLTRRRLFAATRDWESAGHDPSYLFGSGRLEAAEHWRRSSGLPLSEEAEAYLAAGREAVDRHTAAGRRRRRLVVGALAGALALTLTFSVFAVVQQNVAQEQVRLTRARELAGDALLAVDVDPERAILLALQAVDAHRDAQQRPVPEAFSALHTALQASRVRLHLAGGREALAISPDGRLLASDVDGDAIVATDPDGLRTLRVVDTGSGGEVVAMQVRGRIGSLAFSPDGTSLAVGYLDTLGAPAVETFEVDGWTSRATYGAEPHGYLEVGFADDGRSLVASHDALGAVAWNVRSGTVTATFAPVLGLDVVPASPLVAVTQGAEQVVFVDVRDGRTIETLATPGTVGEAVAVDDGGERVVVNSFTGRSVEAWDRTTGARLVVASNPSPTVVDWTPDGRLAHASNDGSIRLLETVGDTPEVVLRGHRSGVTRLAFTPDGSVAASTTWAGETRLWDISAAGNVGLGTLAIPDGLVWQAVEEPGDGRLWVTVNQTDGEQRIELADPVTGTRTVVVGGLRPYQQSNAVLAGDGSGVAGLDAELLGHVYDLPSGEERLRLRPCQLPKALNEDGSLLVVDGHQLCNAMSGVNTVQDLAGASPTSAVLDGRTGEVLIDLGERRLSWASLGPSGTPAEHLVALAVDWQLIEMHDVRSGALTASMDLGGQNSTSIWFSDDGRHLAFGTQEGGVALLEVEDVRPGTSLEDAVAWRYQEPGGSVITHTRSAGGLLATGSMAGDVRVYDLGDRRLLADLDVSALDPLFVGFTIDGTALLYEDGRSLRRLELDLDRLTVLARSALTRGFTSEECEQYRIDASACPI